MGLFGYRPLEEVARPGGEADLWTARCIGSIVSSKRFDSMKGKTYSDKLSSAFAVCTQGRKGLKDAEGREQEMLADPKTMERIQAYERALKTAKQDRAQRKAAKELATTEHNGSKGRWVTMRGTHVFIDSEGRATTGPDRSAGSVNRHR